MEEKLLITYTEKKKEGLIALFSDDSKVLLDYKVAEKFGAFKGAFVNTKELYAANKAFSDKAAIRFALDSLAKSSKTVKQMRDKLKAKFLCEESVEYALNRLIEAGYLNDSEYCESFISLSLQAGKGKNYIKNKLAEKGIPSALIANAMEKIDSEAEAANLRAMLKKQNELLKKYPLPVRREKLLRKAVSAGFSIGQASAVIEELFSCEASEDFEDYFYPLVQKKLKRFGDKYTPDQIKIKLYAEFIPKGADKSLIDRCIEDFSG